MREWKSFLVIQNASEGAFLRITTGPVLAHSPFPGRAVSSYLAARLNLLCRGGVLQPAAKCLASNVWFGRAAFSPQHLQLPQHLPCFVHMKFIRL